MGQLCFNLRYRGGELWAERIVQAVAESNPGEALRAQAAFCLGSMAFEQAFPFSGTVLEERRAALLRTAREHFAEAARHPDVKTSDGAMSLGVKAGAELRRLDNLPHLKVGGLAPEIEGTDLEGKPLKLSDHRGKVVVLVFWGSWCGPCMAMVPHEKELFERHEGKPFALLGVNCGDEIEAARKTVAARGMAWPSFYDSEEPRGPIAVSYDVPHWPRIYVIDAKGVIRHIDVRGEELDRAVDALLAEAR